MYEFKLPDLGEGIHEAEILKWYVAKGDSLAEDDPLVDVETDKAAVTIPSPKGGLVVELSGEPGDTVVVGQVIVVIDESGQGGQARAEQPRAEPVRSEPAPGPPAEAAPPPRPPAAPATRRLARELDVDINRVRPSGPAGRVTPEDVRRAAEGGDELSKPVVEPPRVASEPPTLAAAETSSIPFYEPEPMPDFERWGPVEREPIRSIRRKIARKMVTSMVVVPHVIHMDEADVTDLEAFRRRYREAHPEGTKLNLLAFVARAVVAGLRRWPMFNASLDPDRGEIVYKKYYNLGLAADTPRGLMVPVVKETDRKSVRQIAEEIRALAAAARSGAIELDSLQGGTFTITNIGPLGGIALAPAINYPEVAIMGMGQVQQKPVVRDGEVVVRQMLPLTLSFDHRVADGADAARFVSFVVRLLSDLDELVVEV